MIMENLKPLNSTKTSNLSKSKFNYIDNAFQLNIFSGVGVIENEASSFKDVINYFGFPNTDETDDRGNRILEYSTAGLYFKFINILNDNDDPKVSFIRIKKPYISRNSICPGLKQKAVHEYMDGLKLEKEQNSTEIWSNKRSQHVKFTYDKRKILESILIF